MKSTQHSSASTSPAGTSYRIDGEGSAALFFAHGVGLDKDIWQPQIDAFAGRYQTVSYDLLGHGNSPIPDVDATMDDYVAQLEELRAHLNIDKIAIIGHSTGALICLGYGLAHPEKVTHLVPLNAIYCRPKQAQQAALQRVVDARENGPLKQLETTLIRWFGEEPLTAELQAKKSNLRHCLQRANLSGYATTYRLFVESDRLYEGHLNKITAPTLFLTGELDPNSTPEMSIAMANEVDGASCAIIQGSRHMTPYIDDIETNAIIKEFLQRND